MQGQAEGLSPERRLVFAALANGEAVPVVDVCRFMGGRYEAVRQLLCRMARAGQVERVAAGYRLRKCN